MLSRLPDIMHGAMLALFLNYMILFIVSRKKPGSTTWRVRLIAILMMVMQVIKSTIWVVLGQSATMTPTAAMLNLFAVPFIAFILTEASHKQKVTVQSACENTIPFVILFIAYRVTEGRTIEAVPSAIYYSFLLIMLAYICYYAATFLQVIREHDRKVSEYYADTEGKTIGWFRNMLLVMILLAVLYFTLYIIRGSVISILAYDLLSCIIWSVFAWNILNMEDTDDMDRSFGNETPDEDMAVETGNSLDEFMTRVHDICMDKELYTIDTLKRDDVAKAMLTNHTTLTQKIKKATGMTFSEYIGSIRLEAAARMILESDEKIESIAYSCGYRDKSTFYRAFAKTYGCSPKEYRIRDGKI